MVSLTRSITNTSSVETLTIFVPGYDDTFSVSIAPLATLDLLTVMFAEQLHAAQPELASMVAAGALTVVATISSTALFPATGIALAMSNDTQVVFNPTSGSATHVAGASSTLQIENAGGAIDPYDSSTTVTVTATPVGATTPLINGHASPVILTVSGGIASVLITSSGADTINCAISAVSRTLTHSSTFVATLS
jgi:Ca2+-binding RTX toxin-like protein